MRRPLAALAAIAALLLASVGGTVAAPPGPAPSLAPVVDPTPSGPPAPSSDPGLQPSSDPGLAPSSDPGAATPDPGRALDPASPPAPDTGPGLTVEPVVAPVVRPAAGGTASGHAPRSATDPTNRWIVVLDPGTDVNVALDRQGRRIGFRADRTFRHALRGFSAILDRGQVDALRRDPAVRMIVADERIEAEAETMPTGITRIGADRSTAAKIDGLDDRVDADVAIVDTGITAVADLNVVGGHNCSTTDPTAWRDVYGHGTHVAGTVGALDDGSGVVGVAPGVRLWAVKILNDSGEGLLSWYVCGLDWIAAQRDPVDQSRPLFEAVNMSVAKWGSDDGHCGSVNKDILHAAICRLVASGVTVVAAAGNDSGSAAARVPAAYNEVITVSALADTDGKPGGLGGHRCYSWGTYDTDDTYADFSNAGSDVDLIAPGKCIWSTIPSGYAYMSGTSMAAPHVTGAVALLKSSRPGLTPGEVKEALQYLGNDNWRTSTDPDGHPDKMLDVSRIGPRGDFSVAAGPDVTISEAGGPARFPITLARTTDSFERIRLSTVGLPAGATASFSPSSVYGFAGVASTLTVTMPLGIAVGSYPVTVTADEHGNTHSVTVAVQIVQDVPTARPPTTTALVRSTLGATTLGTRSGWPAATDPWSAITGYELQTSVGGGAWVSTAITGGTVRSVAGAQVLGRSYQYRVRARDLVGNWSDWAVGPTVTGVLVQDRSSTVGYVGRWTRYSYTYASGGTATWATAAGASARTTFNGRGVAIVGPTGPTRGSATVYVDGVKRATVSFRSTYGRSRQVMYATTFATLGTHRIELRVSGTGRVDLDTFVILR